ncbi:hypothetical protein V1525DRAFT_406853 [Lipomyces kononenkoae]|uniref:Uncharacterized protein n=1 Tax=Lipomyces kononenkoae TaxID=34357 RepID=A0ACC3SXS2_LIPKO
MDRMETRQNRPNYFLLNDGIDVEALPEDRLDRVISLENDILPSESASQIQQLQSESSAEAQVEEISTIHAESSTSLAPLQEPLRHGGLSKDISTKWPWTYFEISEFEIPWIVKKSNKRKLIDREIRCAVLANVAGRLVIRSDRLPPAI